ncbi:MAG: sugar kinase [Pyrinomonadaceae bacterium]
MLNIKQKSKCRWDLVSLGEILLRLDPGENRIHDSRTFTIWDGGAEYNVAANLSRVFAARTAIATALTDNPIGRLADGFARQAAVDTAEIVWRDEGRNGLYFIERGFGLRAPASAFDREFTAVSKLTTGSIDWQRIFREEGTRWFHTGGVFTGLSDSTPLAAAEAMKAAQDCGSVVSYDLNYRESLWGRRGGRDAANAANAELLPYADVVFGTFGFDSQLSNFDPDAFIRSSEAMRSRFPDLRIIVSTLRDTHSAGKHSFSAVCSVGGGVFRAKDYLEVEVLDRVGSGDAFAAGFVHGLLEDKGPQFALDCGTAHGVLTMTTPGDVSMCTADEVFGLMQTGGSIAKR